MISRTRDTSRHDVSFIGSCTLHPVLDLSFSHVSCSRPYLCKSFEVTHLRKPISNGSWSMFKRHYLADTCWHKKDSTLLSSFESLPKDTLLGHERQWSSPQVPELIYHDMVIPPWLSWFLEWFLESRKRLPDRMTRDRINPVYYMYLDRGKYYGKTLRFARTRNECPGKPKWRWWWWWLLLWWWIWLWWWFWYRFETL